MSNERPPPDSAATFAVSSITAALADEPNAVSNKVSVVMDLIRCRKGGSDIDVVSDLGCFLRKSLRTNSEIIQRLLLYWETCYRDSQTQRVPKREYLELHMRISKALIANFEYNAALEMASTEWLVDTAGSSILDETLFLEAIFQTVDLWTDCCHVHCYCWFLDTLYDSLTVASGPVTRRALPVHDPVRAAATTRMAAAARQAREARLTTLAEAAEVETAERQLREQRGAADFSVRRESGVWQDSSQVDPRLRFEDPRSSISSSEDFSLTINPDLDDDAFSLAMLTTYSRMSPSSQRYFCEKMNVTSETMLAALEAAGGFDDEADCARRNLIRSPEPLSVVITSTDSSTPSIFSPGGKTRTAGGRRWLSLEEISESTATVFQPVAVPSTALTKALSTKAPLLLPSPHPLPAKSMMLAPEASPDSPLNDTNPIRPVNIGGPRVQFESRDRSITKTPMATENTYPVSLYPAVPEPADVGVGKKITATVFVKKVLLPSSPLATSPSASPFIRPSVSPVPTGAAVKPVTPRPNATAAPTQGLLSVNGDGDRVRRRSVNISSVVKTDTSPAILPTEKSAMLQPTSSSVQPQTVLSRDRIINQGTVGVDQRLLAKVSESGQISTANIPILLQEINKTDKDVSKPMFPASALSTSMTPAVLPLPVAARQFASSDQSFVGINGLSATKSRFDGAIMQTLVAPTRPLARPLVNVPTVDGFSTSPTTQAYLNPPTEMGRNFLIPEVETGSESPDMDFEAEMDQTTQLTEFSSQPLNPALPVLPMLPSLSNLGGGPSKPVSRLRKRAPTGPQRPTIQFSIIAPPESPRHAEHIAERLAAASVLTPPLLTMLSPPQHEFTRSRRRRSDVSIVLPESKQTSIISTTSASTKPSAVSTNSVPIGATKLSKNYASVASTASTSLATIVPGSLPVLPSQSMSHALHPQSAGSSSLVAARRHSIQMSIVSAPGSEIPLAASPLFGPGTSLANNSRSGTPVTTMRKTLVADQPLRASWPSSLKFPYHHAATSSKIAATVGSVNESQYVVPTNLPVVPSSPLDSNTTPNIVSAATSPDRTAVVLPRTRSLVTDCFTSPVTIISQPVRPNPPIMERCPPIISSITPLDTTPVILLADRFLESADQSLPLHFIPERNYTRTSKSPTARYQLGKKKQDPSTLIEGDFDSDPVNTRPISRGPGSPLVSPRRSCLSTVVIRYVEPGLSSSGTLSPARMGNQLPSIQPSRQLPPLLNPTFESIGLTGVPSSSDLSVFPLLTTMNVLGSGVHLESDESLRNIRSPAVVSNGGVSYVRSVSEMGTSGWSGWSDSDEAAAYSPGIILIGRGTRTVAVTGDAANHVQSPHVGQPDTPIDYPYQHMCSGMSHTVPWIGGGGTRPAIADVLATRAALAAFELSKLTLVPNLPANAIMKATSRYTSGSKVSDPLMSSMVAIHNDLFASVSVSEPLSSDFKMAGVSIFNAQTSDTIGGCSPISMNTFSGIDTNLSGLDTSSSAAPSRPVQRVIRGLVTAGTNQSRGNKTFDGRSVAAPGLRQTVSAADLSLLTLAPLRSLPAKVPVELTRGQRKNHTSLKTQRSRDNCTSPPVSGESVFSPIGSYAMINAMDSSTNSGVSNKHSTSVIPFPIRARHESTGVHALSSSASAPILSHGSIMQMMGLPSTNRLTVTKVTDTRIITRLAASKVPANISKSASLSIGLDVIDLPSLNFVAVPGCLMPGPVPSAMSLIPLTNLSYFSKQVRSPSPPSLMMFDKLAENVQGSKSRFFEISQTQTRGMTPQGLTASHNASNNSFLPRVSVGTTVTAVATNSSGGWMPRLPLTGVPLPFNLQPIGNDDLVSRFLPPPPKPSNSAFKIMS